MRNHRIAAMGGDGIGPEVVRAAVEVLRVAAERDGGFALHFDEFDWGSLLLPLVLPATFRFFKIKD